MYLFEVPEPEKKIIRKPKPEIIPPKKEEISFKKGIVVNLLEHSAIHSRILLLKHYNIFYIVLQLTVELYNK